MFDIGIDLGTSAVKLLLVSDEGKVMKAVSRSYPLEFPHPGWSQQAPQDWWSAILDGVPELISGIDPAQVGAIGVAGQMHGLVAVDEQGRVLRPAILWNDGRTAEETDDLNNKIGKDFLLERTGNIAFAGFTAPKILWMRKNEPELFARIAKVLLPKDYVNFRLTGRYTTDFSDAAGTLLLDVKNKRWSQDMLAICGLTADQMPALHESWDVVGTLLPDVAKQLGLPETVQVVAGAGDNAAAAIGAGCLSEGQCNLSLGTSGTVFLPCEQFKMDTVSATHAFNHAAGNYHLMGCMLSAASCLKWWVEEVCKSHDYAGLQSEIDPDRLGRNHVYFL
ncbi:MAG: xylulokinase, partial [Clostridia bacterium]|nr:xylulokinase [Clostridia bacterium]